MRGSYLNDPCRELRTGEPDGEDLAPKVKPSRARFDALRARYVAAAKADAEHDSSLRVKYGLSFQSAWLSAAERKKVERLGAAREKASAAFYAYLQSISPRDWSYGVPCSWLYEELTYEDAVRPVGEPLSVVPPLAYGYSEPRT